MILRISYLREGVVIGHDLVVKSGDTKDIIPEGECSDSI